ncbi:MULTISPECIES: T9SS-dependent choice-of-anchor J family protein [Flavobacterium]|uniref:Fibronectin type-III domain-containing protein n=2 Tax=Bacteria TaxID=2 RepID=A0ABP8ZN60_9FLAO|nr:choice-of-anchor J domain-containing protein [Flavobacterium sp. N1846]
MQKNYNLKAIFLVFILSLFSNSSFYGQITTLDPSGNFKVNGYSGLWWDYQYKPTGSSTYTQSQIQYSASSSFVKLNPFISWDFRIRYYNSFGQPGVWEPEHTVNSNYFNISKSVGYNFNFNTSFLDEGWRGYRLQNTTSEYYSFIMESNYLVNGSSGKSIDMKWSSGYGMMMVSPKITDLSSDKMFSIYANSYQGAYSVVLGTMSNPYDPTTFHPLKTVNLPYGGYNKINVFLNNYVSNDQYIAIKSNGNYGEVFFDDFSYEQSVNCYDLTNVALNNISEHNATLSYNSNTASSYEINLKNLSTGATQTFTTNSSSYTFTNLAGLTNYEVKVRGNCAPDLYTNWSQVISFSTPCNIVTADYFTSFGEEYTIDPCWKKITYSTTITNSSSITVNSILAVSPKSGSKMVNIYASSELNQKGYLISPFISDLNTNKRIKFYLTSYGSDYVDRSITIGTMSNPADESTFVPLENIFPDDINQYNGYKVNGHFKQHIVYFNNYNQNLNHNYIAFKVNNSTNFNSINLYIDDFTYENSPSCKEPTNLKCIRTDFNYAKIKWTDFDQSSTEWEVEYGIKGFTIGTGTRISVNSNPFTINSNLIPNQEYDFYVRTKCGNNIYSNWSDRGTFKTKCSGFTVGYTTSFENESIQANNTCWSRTEPNIRNTFYANSFVEFITYPNGNTPVPLSGSTLARIFSRKDCPDPLVNEKSILITPRLTDLDSNKKILFSAYINSSMYSSINSIQIGTMSDIDDYTTFVPYQSITNELVVNQWKEYTVDFSSYTGSNQFIGIRIFSNSSSNDIVFIDNFKYLNNDCTRPGNLSAYQNGSSSALLNWNTNNNNSVNCEIEYGLEGFTLGTGQIIQVTQNPFVLNNLNSNSKYQFRVRNICNSGVVNWSDLYTFKVSCSVSSPFVENFDQYPATNAFLIPDFCWTVNDVSNDNLYGGVKNVYYENFNSPPNVGHFYNSNTAGKFIYFISPYLSDFDNTKKIKFWINNVREISTSQVLILGTLSNSVDFNTFTPYQTIDLANLPAYGKEINIDFSNYTGTNKHIAFKLSGENISDYFYIDDFQYLNNSNCTEPINVQLLNISSNSLKITWDNNSAQNTQIEYGPFGFIPGSGTILNSNTNEIVITNLQPTTKYDFYLRSNCSSNQSITIGPKTVETTCTIEPLPWLEDFSNLPQYGSNLLPECFEKLPGGTITSYNSPLVLNTNYYNPNHTLNGNGDSSYLWANNFSGPDGYRGIIVPMFNLMAGTTYTFSLDARKAYEYDAQSLRLFVGKGKKMHYMEAELSRLGTLSEYNYNTNSFSFTPITSGDYSFILHTQASGSTNMSLDNFKIIEGYTNIVTSNNDLFNFDNGNNNKLIIESTQNSFASIVTDVNNISNKVLKMSGSNNSSTWRVDQTNIWESNQNHITKVNMKINATSMTSLFLLFDLKQTFVNFNNESMFRVVVNGVVLGNIIRPTTNNQDIFKTFQYDLTPFVGGDIRISLQHIGKSSNDIGDNAYLDNLRFSPVPLLSTNENNFIGLKYYPNPVDNILNIENNSVISSVEILSVTGQSLFIKSFLTNNITIDTNNFAHGVYFIKITSENKSKTLKIIKD